MELSWTDAIRKPWVAAARGIFLAAVLHALSSAACGQELWYKQTIDDNLPDATVMYVADMDGDGDLDVAATAWTEADVVWYTNAGDDTTWTKHFIDGGLRSAIGVCVADVNGNGRMDVIAAGFQADAVKWYQNQLPSPDWSTRTIDLMLDGANWVDAGDLDGDGDNDIAATGYADGTVVWYENDGADPPGWEKHIIDDDMPEARQVHIGDVNGDSLLDVAASCEVFGTIKLYLNRGGTPISWEPQVVTNSLGGVRAFCLGDIDNDGDVDMVGSGSTSHMVVLYENGGDAPITWKAVIVDDSIAEPRGVAIGDINMDTEPDVAVGSYTGGEIYFYTRANDWKRHIVAQDLRGASVGCVIDMNGDGDPDIVADGQSANDLSWYRNPAIPDDVASPAAALPERAVLHQNYPNPFNPSTAITFTIPRRGAVRLRVFDLLGREVTRLVDGVREAGTHRVRFDGAGQPAGVYCYRLSWGDGYRARSMVLLK